MLSNARSAVSLLRSCALLLLAFSVFGFGLQARLAQYQPYPPNPTAAKIATEKQSEKVLKVLAERDQAPQPIEWLAHAFSLSGVLIQPISPSVIAQAEIRLSNPTRFDLNGFYSLHRPPPTLL
ncbi:hypothetical protein [Granulicella mallensis]|uniref:Uncharacterized protein n=1 Tax=Granulicella mallensis (strain ATCC BAA-1857 / DSM 23137 / MP5ACTX8) TaxID=682795 RepID=G8NRG6_GRAMM|nr:hypothetical protein [Granulicella mallensis]AEU37324.1 hypothetical protein AciX8_3021 [Granulicella mallensis MP5ACTX8]